MSARKKQGSPKAPAVSAAVRPVSLAGLKKKIVPVVVIVFILLIILRLLLFFSSRGRKSASGTEGVPVEALRVKTEMIRDVIALTERLQALSDVNLYSPVPGTINSINVDIGSKVWKNQIVATVDRNVVGSEYENAIVKASIAGEVGRILVDKGTSVSPATPVMNIINYSTIKIYVNIPEKYMNRVNRGDTALINLEAQDTEEYLGRIDQVSSSIDPLTGTFQAKIIVPNKLEKIKPGSFARIRIVLATRKTLVISKEAIIDNEEALPFVYRISNETTRKAYIRQGIEEEARVEITSGLKENDLVVTTGKEIVKTGTGVLIENREELGLATRKSNAAAPETKTVKKKEQPGAKDLKAGTKNKK